MDKKSTASETQGSQGGIYTQNLTLCGLAHIWFPFLLTGNEKCSPPHTPVLHFSSCGHVGLEKLLFGPETRLCNSMIESD